MIQELPAIDVLALNICDTVVREHRHPNLSMIGLFYNLFLPDFPAWLPRISVYVAISEIRRPAILIIRIVDANQTIIVQSDTPLVPHIALPQQHVTVFHQAKVNHPGKYSVQVLADADLITEAPLTLHLPPAPRIPK